MIREKHYLNMMDSYPQCDAPAAGFSAVLTTANLLDLVGINFSNASYQKLRLR